MHYCTGLKILKALGTGADMLLGGGGGVFDDMLDAGVNFCGTSQLPAAAHDHLGDDKSQAETGLLGQAVTAAKRHWEPCI